MEAKEARQYLYSLKKFYEADEGYEKWAEALEVALDAVAPPTGAGYCEWIYLPDKDLMPKKHLDNITKIEDAVDSLKTELKEEDSAPVGILRVNKEWAEILLMALLIYKSVLMKVNKKEIMESLKDTVKAIGKAQKEGKFDGDN